MASLDDIDEWDRLYQQKVYWTAKMAVAGRGTVEQRDSYLQADLAETKQHEVGRRIKFGTMPYGARKL